MSDNIADSMEPRGDLVDPSEAARTLGKLGASKGGMARAKSLTPERRREIAQRAVKSRWEKAKAGEIPPIPRAIHTGVLKIGDTELPCAVLEDGTRVFTQSEFLDALGRSKKPAGRRGGDDEQLPAFLVARNLKPFISEDLRESSRPILFRPKIDAQTGEGENAKVVLGYRVELLPEVCRVYLEARDAGVLMPGEQHGQKRIAARCDMLIRGLARVGIIALVDEATGYQYHRARKALEEILEQFISKELVKWAKTFPDEFYQELFRLRKWRYDPNSSRRPIHVAKLTIDIVYERIAPGVLQELKRLTPRDHKGRLKQKLFQRLTEDMGHPRLREHLAASVALMRAFDEWDVFYERLQRVFPKFNETPMLKIMYDDRSDQLDAGGSQIDKPVIESGSDGV
jgi:hypothetical protein